MKKILLLFFVALILSLNNNINAQHTSTKGKDFWFGFMSNVNGGALYTFISSETNTSGTISIPGLGWTQTFNVSANSTIGITMPPSVEPPFSEGIYDLAIHVSSCDSITVYAHSAYTYTSDATVIYPTPALQDKYMVLNWSPASGYSNGDEILIVATQDSTHLQITPAIATAGGYPAGVPYNITLNKGQIYQVTNTDGSIDFTGTTINSLTPGDCVSFAVFSGNKCTFVGNCGTCDHLYEQLLPLVALGKEYILPPLKNKSTTIYKIMATQNATSISINGGMSFMLSAGQDYQFSDNTASYVSASQPIMIMQYAQGNGCDGIGDPFQILMYPIEQYLQDITFNAFISGIITEYWANIVVKTVDVPNVVLDGVNIASSFSPVPSNAAFSYAQVSISMSTHRLISPGGALTYVYGWGSADSFGYCAGAALRDLTNDFTISPNPTCIGSTINFAAIPDSISSAYEWSFGDSSPNAFGLNTSHSFTSEGVFEVTLTKYRASGCNIVVKKNVYIINPPIKMHQNDTTICAGSQLQLSADANVDSLEVYYVNDCGDTTITYESSYFDSLTWSTGDTGSVITVTPTSNMVVYVYGHKTGEICVGIDSIVINVIESPSFTLEDFCEGTANSANISGTTGGVFSIVSPLGDGATIDATTGEIFNGIGGTTYTVEYESSGICTNIITEQVTVFPVAEVSLVATPIIGEPPLEVEFNQNSSNVDHLIWYFGDGETLQSMSSVVFHTFENIGVFTTTLIGNSSNGCVDSANVEIIVVIPDLDYTFPNVFTPNGDGENDLYNIINPQGIAQLKIIILNRWGNLVFESDETDFYWDGKAQKTNENCSDGTYFYKATIIGKNGEERTEHGFIHLNRGE